MKDTEQAATHLWQQNVWTRPAAVPNQGRKPMAVFLKASLVTLMVMGTAGCLDDDDDDDEDNGEDTTVEQDQEEVGVALPREDSDKPIRITAEPDGESEEALEVRNVQFASGECEKDNGEESENYLFLLHDTDWAEEPVLGLGERQCGEELLNEAEIRLLAEASMDEVEVTTGGWDGGEAPGGEGGDLHPQPYVLHFVGEVLDPEDLDSDGEQRYQEIKVNKDSDGEEEDIRYESPGVDTSARKYLIRLFRAGQIGTTGTRRPLWSVVSPPVDRTNRAGRHPSG